MDTDQKPIENRSETDTNDDLAARRMLRLELVKAMLAADVAWAANELPGFLVALERYVLSGEVEEE